MDAATFTRDASSWGIEIVYIFGIGAVMGMGMGNIGGERGHLILRKENTGIS